MSAMEQPQRNVRSTLWDSLKTRANVIRSENRNNNGHNKRKSTLSKHRSSTRNSRRPLQRKCIKSIKSNDKKKTNKHSKKDEKRKKKKETKNKKAKEDDDSEDDVEDGSPRRMDYWDQLEAMAERDRKRLQVGAGPSIRDVESIFKKPVPELNPAEEAAYRHPMHEEPTGSSQGAYPDGSLWDGLSKESDKLLDLVFHDPPMDTDSEMSASDDEENANNNKRDAKKAKRDAKKAKRKTKKEKSVSKKRSAKKTKTKKGTSAVKSKRTSKSRISRKKQTKKRKRVQTKSRRRQNKNIEPRSMLPEEHPPHWYLQWQCNPEAAPQQSPARQSNKTGAESKPSELKHDESKQTEANASYQTLTRERALSAIQSVTGVVESLEAEVNGFQGNDRRSKEYVRLEQLLTTELVKLDAVETGGDPRVRAARRTLVARVLALLDLLDRKFRMGIYAH